VIQYANRVYAFIIRQIGVRTDVASASGSLHAKIGEARSTLNNNINTRQKPRAAVAPGSFMTQQTSYQTALNITGIGRLLGLLDTAPTGGISLTKVTIDGIVVQESRNGNSGVVAYPDGAWRFTTDSTAYAWLTLANGGRPDFAELNFKQSLKIEYKSANGNPATLKWVYELEG